MSQGYRSVLAVIEGDLPESTAVVERAAAIAEESHSWLTLAGLAQLDSRVAWLAALALTAGCLAPTRDDSESLAQHGVARAAEFIPATVGLTTMVISWPPRRRVRRLLAGDRYDLLVIGARLASKHAFANLPIAALIVPSVERAPPSPASAGLRLLR
jgi:hypothetical protein